MVTSQWLMRLPMVQPCPTSRSVTARVKLQQQPLEQGAITAMHAS